MLTGRKHEASWIAKAAVLEGTEKPELCNRQWPLDAETGWRKLRLLEEAGLGSTSLVQQPTYPHQPHQLRDGRDCAMET